MMMSQSVLQSALSGPSKPSEPNKPTTGKPLKGIPAQVPGYKQPAQASPTNLASAMFGVAPGSQQAATVAQARPDYSQVEANAEREFMASLANNPQRRAMGSLAAENAAQLDPNRGMPQGVDEGLAGRMAGFGDRRVNQQMAGMGMFGNQRGRQFNTGLTAFAGGPLVEAITGEPRQSSFSAERRDAAIAAIKDGTFRDRAIVNTRPTFATADDADRFTAYQDRRQDRRENALAMRREIGQEREAARQQAMVAQAEAAQNPMNSPMFRQLMMSRPEAAVDFASAVIDANTRRLLGLGEWNNRARLAEADAGIERERLKDGRDRFATDAEIRRESLRSRESIAEGDRAQRSITARESNQSREQLSRDRMSFQSRGVEARAARDEAAAKSLEAENTPEAQRRAVVFEIWDRLSRAGYLDPKLKEQVFGELVDGLNQ
jgi:hypothetical protein